MAEKKLGPGVTYKGTANYIEIAGVKFTRGKRINLVSELTESRAAPILAKLAGNQFFEVEGAGKAAPEAVEARKAAETQLKTEAEAGPNDGTVPDEDDEEDDDTPDEPESHADDLPPDATYRPPETPELELPRASQQPRRRRR